MQDAYNPVFPLIRLYKPGTEEYIKHSFRQTDNQGITRCSETKVRIVNSEAKEEAFLHFLYKFSWTRKLRNLIHRTTLLSKFEFHLQGSYQNDW
jgi:hypothetical protein